MPLVEEGWLDHEVIDTVLREYVAPMLAGGVDTLVLGTHYPLLKESIVRGRAEVALRIPRDVRGICSTEIAIAHLLATEGEGGC